jgi:hypothetical protein
MNLDLEKSTHLQLYLLYALKCKRLAKNAQILSYADMRREGNAKTL